jgi:multiple sugar transport system ATP-binding protein
MATVELRNVGKRFGDHDVVHDVDLLIKEREFVAFVGPSGSGKSTLLRMIAGLEQVTQGEVLINGTPVQNVPPSKRGLAMVFQSYALYPHMTVAENMSFSLRLAGVSKQERDQKVRAVAQVLQMEPLLDRKPGQLSGGQMQRVAIGRAMVRQPQAFLLDEPLSNLDAALQAQMRLELVRLHRELAATMIYVTHDQLEAMTMADRIVVLNDGGIEQVGTPLELYQFPATIFVAGFIGAPKMNFLSAEVSAVHDSVLSLLVANSISLTVPISAETVVAGERLTIGIRPEHVAIDGAGKFWGKIEAIEHLGARAYVHARLDSDVIVVAETNGSPRYQPGDLTGFAPNPQECHLFSESGKALRRKVTGASATKESHA